MESCLNIGVTRIGNPIVVSSDRIGDGLSVTPSRIGIPLGMQAERVNEPMALSSARVGKPLTFRVGLVCTISQARYLKVAPGDIWLLPENDFNMDVAVYSNVTWTIE